MGVTGDLETEDDELVLGVLGAVEEDDVVNSPEPSVELAEVYGVELPPVWREPDVDGAELELVPPMVVAPPPETRDDEGMIEREELADAVGEVPSVTPGLVELADDRVELADRVADEAWP